MMLRTDRIGILCPIWVEMIGSPPLTIYCRWKGVRCASQEAQPSCDLVTYLDVSGFGIDGIVPPSLGDLYPNRAKSQINWTNSRQTISQYVYDSIRWAVGYCAPRSASLILHHFQIEHILMFLLQISMQSISKTALASSKLISTLLRSEGFNNNFIGFMPVYINPVIEVLGGDGNHPSWLIFVEIPISYLMVLNLNGSPYPQLTFQKKMGGSALYYQTWRTIFLRVFVSPIFSHHKWPQCFPQLIN